MKTEAILLSIITALLAALYAAYPEDCTEVAGALGRVVTSLTDFSGTPSSVISEGAHGETAMMRHSANGHVGMVTMLLDDGFDPNRQDDDGNTALMRAAAGGHTNLVQLLLEKGADPDLQTTRGGTALMHASFKGHVDVVRLLIKHQADTRIVDEYAGTALMRAADKGHASVVKVLLEESAPAHRAAFIDTQHKYDGYTALMRAATNGHVQVVSYLLEYRASMQISNSWGKTVMTMVREHRPVDASIMQVLMDAGAKE